MAASVGNDHEMEVNLTPLLDIVLQLVMFFLITVNFKRVDESNPDILLPPAQHAVPLDNSAYGMIFLNLDKDGKVLGSVGSTEKLIVADVKGIKRYVEKEAEFMKRRARAAGKEDKGFYIVLRAHRQCRTGDIFSVLSMGDVEGCKGWKLGVMTSKTSG